MLLKKRSIMEITAQPCAYRLETFEVNIAKMTNRINKTPRKLACKTEQTLSDWNEHSLNQKCTTTKIGLLSIQLNRHCHYSNSNKKLAKLKRERLSKKLQYSLTRKKVIHCLQKQGIMERCTQKTLSWIWYFLFKFFHCIHSTTDFDNRRPNNL